MLLYRETSELTCGIYYFWTLLNYVGGPISYEDIRIVVHPNFKDALYAFGLLCEDKEYIIQILRPALNFNCENYLLLCWF